MKTRATRPARSRRTATRSTAADRPVRVATPSPFAAFRRDHARVLARLVTLEATLPVAGLARRTRVVHEAPLRALIAHLERQFATHMAAEEAVLYPALEHAFPESGPSLRPLHEEHVELRTMLAVLAETLLRPATRGRDEQVMVQVRDFVDLLRIHIRKEEAVVFDVSERVLGARELRGLARRLAPFVPANAPKASARRNPRSRPS